MTSEQLVLAPTEMQAREIRKAAIISPCGKYRYRLWRQWEWTDRMPVMWVMLNPSTADANIDDPTIKRCMKFSQAWGYGAMWVGNLYAYRTPYPSVLWEVPGIERVGPENERHLYQMASQSEKVICAWGANEPSFPNIQQIGCPGGYWHLGLTASRQPKHPLARGKAFIPYDAPVLEYRV